MKDPPHNHHEPSISEERILRCNEWFVVVNDYLNICLVSILYPHQPEHFQMRPNMISLRKVTDWVRENLSKITILPQQLTRYLPSPFLPTSSPHPNPRTFLWTSDSATSNPPSPESDIFKNFKNFRFTQEGYRLVFLWSELRALPLLLPSKKQETEKYVRYIIETQTHKRPFS